MSNRYGMSTSDTARLKSNLMEELTSDKSLDDLCNRMQRRCRQEFGARLEEKVKGPLEDLKDRVSRRIWNVAQRHMEWDVDQPHLFPGVGTRLYYRKGDTSVLLYDMHPQVRTVTFQAELISRDAAEQRDFHLNLAFPYLVFAVHFVQGRFQNLHLSFLNEPLTEVHQRPLAPAVSNIEKNSLRVCMGDFRMPEGVAPYDLQKQTTAALDSFWASQFTGNWREYFDECQKLDPRLRTPRKWEAASRADPSFVLGINWPHSGYPTYRHLCTRLFEQDQKVQQVNQSLFNDLVSETASELQGVLDGQKTAEDPDLDAAIKKECRSYFSGVLSTVLPEPSAK